MRLALSTIQPIRLPTQQDNSDVETPTLLNADV